MRVRVNKRRVFEFIRYSIEWNDQAPTMAEIGAEFQLKSSASVYDILVSLEREGFIKRTPNVSRGIEIVRQSAPMVGWLDR